MCKHVSVGIWFLNTNQEILKWNLLPGHQKGVLSSDYVLTFCSWPSQIPQFTLLRTTDKAQSSVFGFLPLLYKHYTFTSLSLGDFSPFLLSFVLKEPSHFLDRPTVFPLCFWTFSFKQLYYYSDELKWERSLLIWGFMQLDKLNTHKSPKWLKLRP